VSLLVASVAMAAAAALAVIYPIFVRRAALVRDVTAGAVLDAEARKRVALVELKEIEYDFLGGKIDETDYRMLRERISREALDAIRAVDVVRGGIPVPRIAAATGAEAERQDGGSVAVLPAPFEHECGFGNPGGSRFCGGCGARID